MTNYEMIMVKIRVKELELKKLEMKFNAGLIDKDSYHDNINQIMNEIYRIQSTMYE